ncbi:MAG: hypothetical protein FWF78_10095 [Defluviitaleaceae bacterium]|nr:hypothetical protein [Defluviitaleaceae bacterium]
MHVLFDLQGEIDELDLKTSARVIPTGSKTPALEICDVDGVKSIRVKDRKDQIAGIGIPLVSMPVKVGDRITITGRVARDVPMGSWGIALWAEECQLAQSISPKSLFALSYVLCDTDLNSVITVQTTRWGAINPIMDFFVDNILIWRDKKVRKSKEDPRNIIYDMESDEKLLPDGSLAVEGLGEDVVYTGFLAHSGSPDVKVFLDDNNRKAMHISNRQRDWDAVDIRLNNMELMSGNSYMITVEGSIDGDVTEGTIVTLQGLPGYSWRSNQLVGNNQKFTLCYTLTKAEAEQWHTIRITTNPIGATVSFYIHSIEIKRLGLL